MASVFRRAAGSSSSSSSSGEEPEPLTEQGDSGTRKEETPLPMRKILILGLLLMANNCSIWMIFSFLPFMIHDFFPDYALTELGNRTGYLGSAFSVGSLLGNFMWGIASDKWGRRPALLCGLAGTVLSSALFGFSSTFALAIASRFLWGLLNGNIGVSKTYMAEILDDTNNARGMTLYGVIGGAGRILGPALGGYLSNPGLTYPGLFGGTIFETFPYLLPCAIVSGQCMIMTVVAYFELPETASFLRSSAAAEPAESAAAGAPALYSALPASEDSAAHAHSPISSSGDVEMADMESPSSCKLDGGGSLSSPDSRYE